MFWLLENNFQRQNYTFYTVVTISRLLFNTLSNEATGSVLHQFKGISEEQTHRYRQKWAIRNDKPNFPKVQNI